MNRYLSRVFLAAVVAAALAPLCAGEDSDQDQNARRLHLVKYVEPRYPIRMRLNGVTRGEVTTWMTVDHAGRLLDVYATEFSDRSFADAAVAAIRKWEFEPAADTTTLPQLSAVKFNFMLEGLVVAVVHPDDRPVAVDPLLMRSNDHRSYSLDELDAIPAGLHTPMPRYPDALKPERKSGRVEVLFLIDESGQVRVPSIVRADDPAFAKAVLAALRDWTFAVPKRRGQPVSAYSLHSFNFGPRDRSNG